MLTLLACYASGMGGAERALVEAAVALDGDVVAACPAGPVTDALRAAGVTTFELPERSPHVRASVRDRVAAPLRLGGHARELREIVAGLRPDVVVGWGMRSGLASAAAIATLRRPPEVVFSHHDMLPPGVVARAVRLAAGRARLTVTCSHAAARDLDPRGGLGDRLAVVQPGVDLERFRPPAGEAQGERHPTALMFGALVGSKRPALALEIVALARAELPELRLLIVGRPLTPADELLIEPLLARAAAPDLEAHVEIVARGVGDPAALMRDAACLLHCADREAFGRVLVEALASGVPVAAPAAAGPLEIVTDGCGRLYEPGDARAGARALAETLRELREDGAALAARCRERAHAFSIERYQERWREHIAAVGAARSRAAAGPRDVVAGTDGGDGRGLSIVVVSHESAEELPPLLASIGRTLPAAEVVVTDSGSSDASAQIARDWRGGATVIEAGNVGFGRASNAGVRAATRPVTVLLNPDCELVDGSLAQLAAEARRPGVPERLLAPAVVGGDGLRQDTAHPRPASAATLATALVPPAVLPGRLRRALQPWRSRTPVTVGWAVGCCLVARTGTLRRLGPFDERIFLYGEDLDLSLRAAAAGIPTLYWPRARVLHHGGRSARRTFGGEPVELLTRQRRAVVFERLGPSAGRREDAELALTFTTRIVLKTLTGRSSRIERRRLRALLAARREPVRLARPRR